jgi:hypothetical protein
VIARATAFAAHERRIQAITGADLKTHRQLVQSRACVAAADMRGRGSQTFAEEDNRLGVVVATAKP